MENKTIYILFDWERDQALKASFELDTLYKWSEENSKIKIVWREYSKDRIPNNVGSDEEGNLWLMITETEII